jgi:hypothetical protein
MGRVNPTEPELIGSGFREQKDFRRDQFGPAALNPFVPAQAGTQPLHPPLDARWHGNERI